MRPAPSIMHTSANMRFVLLPSIISLLKTNSCASSCVASHRQNLVIHNGGGDEILTSTRAV